MLATLRRLADGSPRIDVSEATVGDALRVLERRYPALAGWILDEQGDIHVAVFVNGERCGCDSSLQNEDDVDVLPAITGGR